MRACRATPLLANAAVYMMVLLIGVTVSGGGGSTATTSSNSITRGEAPGAVPASADLTVSWDPEQLIKVASTAATVEVDVMPFLGRTLEGGPFNSYFEALSDLGAEFVRFSPWFPYPQVVVTELSPPDCTPVKPATNWNSTLFDAVVSDFMLAVCGPDAVRGECQHSVAQQLSTMPAWLFKSAYPIPKGVLPNDPWQYNDFMAYVGVEINGTWDTETPWLLSNGVLHDETCSELAAYMTRVVQHYTAGGHHDSCGHWHPSGFHYNWTVLSVLNENERHVLPRDGVRNSAQYTRCFDAIRAAVERIDPTIQLAGPEIVLGGQGAYTHYFLDPANHKDGRAPEIISNHAYFGSSGSFFAGADSFMAQVDRLVADRDAKAPEAELVLNEWIPMIQDWCDEGDAARAFAEHGSALERDSDSGCPSWQDPKSNATRANRKTLSWNMAAASFAYGYGLLALRGYKYVGADQLIGGPFPDNNPGVSCVCWKSGQVNSKFWAIKMLANALGAGPKSLFNASFTPSGPPPPPFRPGTTATGTCGVTLVCTTSNCCNTQASGGFPWDGSITNISACAAKAKSCGMANFVSYSSAQKDCSWYRDCDMSQLLHPSTWHGESEVLKSVPQVARPPQVFAMPYARHDTGVRGVLLVNKVGTPIVITLNVGAGSRCPNATAALVLDGSIDGLTADPEPGFVPPVERLIGVDCKLALGPFAVALVTGAGLGRAD